MREGPEVRDRKGSAEATKAVELLDPGGCKGTGHPLPCQHSLPNCASVPPRSCPRCPDTWMNKTASALKEPKIQTSRQDTSVCRQGGT